MFMHMPASGVWSTVTVDKTVADVEAAARELVGRRVDEVRYYTLPYGPTDKPGWDEGVAHVVECGADMSGNLVIGNGHEPEAEWSPDETPVEF
jgi:hypothetical protein